MVLRRFEIAVRVSGAMPKIIYMTCCKLRSVVYIQNELHRKRVERIL